MSWIDLTAWRIKPYCLTIDAAHYLRQAVDANGSSRSESPIFFKAANESRING